MGSNLGTINFWTIGKKKAFGRLKISRAESSVGVMYHTHGPNTGSNPRGGQIIKKMREINRLCRHYEDHMKKILKGSNQ